MIISIFSFVADMYLVMLCSLDVNNRQGFHVWSVPLNESLHTEPGSHLLVGRDGVFMDVTIIYCFVG